MELQCNLNISCPLLFLFVLLFFSRTAYFYIIISTFLNFFFSWFWIWMRFVVIMHVQQLQLRVVVVVVAICIVSATCISRFVQGTCSNKRCRFCFVSLNVMKLVQLIVFWHTQVFVDNPWWNCVVAVRCHWMKFCRSCQKLCYDHLSVKNQLSKIWRVGNFLHKRFIYSHYVRITHSSTKYLYRPYTHDWPLTFT